VVYGEELGPFSHKPTFTPAVLPLLSTPRSFDKAHVGVKTSPSRPRRRHAYRSDLLNAYFSNTTPIFPPLRLALHNGLSLAKDTSLRDRLEWSSRSRYASSFRATFPKAKEGSDSNGTRAHVIFPLSKKSTIFSLFLKGLAFPK